MTTTEDQLTGANGAHAGRAIATEAGRGRAWWFLGTLAVLRNPDGAPRTPTIIELTIPPGGSPPAHVRGKSRRQFLPA